MPAVLHWSPEQKTAGVPPQTPFVQRSPLVQRSSSSQGVSLATGVGSQAPDVGLQTRSVQASSSGPHATGVPATHTPIALPGRSHVSTPLQALPSPQATSLAQHSASPMAQLPGCADAGAETARTITATSTHIAVRSTLTGANIPSVRAAAEVSFGRGRLAALPHRRDMLPSGRAVVAEDRTLQ